MDGLAGPDPGGELGEVATVGAIHFVQIHSLGVWAAQKYTSHYGPHFGVKREGVATASVIDSSCICYRQL